MSKHDKNTPLLAFDMPLTDDMPLELPVPVLPATPPAPVAKPAPTPIAPTDDLLEQRTHKDRRKTKRAPAGRRKADAVSAPADVRCECAIYQTCDVCAPLKARVAEQRQTTTAEGVEVSASVVVEQVDDDAAVVDTTPPHIVSDAPIVLETDGVATDHFQLTAPPSELYHADSIIDAAFAHFRETGFPYRKLPLFVAMQELNKLSRTEQSSLLHTTAAYQVADTYNPHRFHAAAEKMKSPIESFADDAKLRHALKLQLEQAGQIPDHYFSTLGIVRGTQSCSNFRPGFACLLYREYCPAGSVVLDTSTGYGGRLVGFLASKVGKRYIGIDPNTLTHAGNLRMAHELGFGDIVELHNLPAEDVPHDLVRERCDFSFTSPPYFAKEHYSDEDTQSWKRYGDSFDRWVSGFLRPMLLLTFVALKRDSYALINIADVTLRGKRWPLVQATVDSAKSVGFTHVCTRMFPLNVRVGANQQTEIPYEPVLVFKKP